MSKVKQIPKCSIDSLKLRIPINEIKILDSSILDSKRKLVINNDTGEIISEDVIKSLSTEINFPHYKIKVAIVSIWNFSKKSNFEFLEIYLHSKILQTNYFNGITSKDIQAIYKRLMKRKVFHCTYESFMNGAVNDIDIKLDIETNTDVFKSLCKELKNQATEFNTLGQGAKLYSNGNLTFNRRESSTISKPFVKFYDKGIEAIDKNKEFFTEYINLDLTAINVKRIEVTCKKSSDIKSYFELENSNLKSILDIKQESLKNYLRFAINQNLKKGIKIAESSEKQNSNLDTFIHLHFVNSITNQGQTYQSTLNEVLNHFTTDKVNKARIKKRCENWYINYESKETEIKDIEIRKAKNQNNLRIKSEVIEIFNLIGI
jgi:uncharacterized protein (DUF4415 family)